MAVPARVGRYHVLDRIASGGMAEIHRAKTVGIAGFEKLLALKRLSPRYARDPRFLRSFVDEARIAVALNHRNIVQVYDFGKADGELYLAMELIDGLDLRTALARAAERGVDIGLDLACYILAELAAGVDHAHGKTDDQGRSLGIVHCDISPHNVMLSRDGYVKILDFGIARAEFTLAPRSRRLRGKPRYMAPEQTFGDDPTPATDVFALGIVAWELLTGRSLFEGKDLSSILELVRRTRPALASDIAPTVPVDLARAVGRALSHAPGERGTAADVGDAVVSTIRARPAFLGSRALASWLADLEPSESAATTPLPEPTETTLTASLVVRDHLQGVEVSEVTPAPTMPGPSLAPLLFEKRRVVASAVVIEAGDEAARVELARLLGELAYKRGAVAHPQDDGVVALFGLELAGEDDVAAAMRYAVDASELARAAALAIRIGTVTGIAVVRHGAELRVRGDAVRDARALAGEAEPGRPLLAGAATRTAAAEFAFRELPPARHGRRGRVLELIGARDHDDRARALLRRRGSLVGRAAELDRLAEAIARARDGSRRIAIGIAGGAGVGKSRIVAELAARVAAEPDPPRRIAVAASPGAQDQPFALIVQLVQAALGLPPGRGELARSRLSQRLRRLLGDAIDPAEAGDCVAAIEIATELCDGALIAATQESADLRDRVTVALRTFRRALGRDPVLLVLENVHAADRASADVVRALLGSPEAGVPELVVVTWRPAADGAAVPLAAAVDDVIAVAELSPSDARELIIDRLGDAADEPAIAAVARRAGGNPLFIEELATAVRERGADSIPPTASDVIAARVDRLPAPTKAVLQHAAVLGPSFRTALLRELAGAQVHDHLAALADAGLLDAREDEMTFRHGLFQEVVYERISASARRQTHAMVGRLLAMRADAGADEPPAPIARHLELGGVAEDAARYWLRTGQVALAAFDVEAARDAFTRALDLDAGARREALLGRERAVREIGDHAAQARDLEALDALARRDPELRAEVANRAAGRMLRLGQYAGAIQLSRDAEQAATAAGDDLARGEALRLRGEAFERTGEFDAALELAGRAIEIFGELGAFGHETRAMIGIGRNHLTRSRYEAAREAYLPILVRLEERPDPWLERVVYNHVAVIHHCLGEFEAAMESAERSLRICLRHGDRARVGDNLSVTGVILIEVGQYAAARPRFERALRYHEQTGSRWSRADCLVYAGSCDAALGDTERGFARMHEALALAREIGSPYIEANAGVALAGAHLRRDRRDDRARAADIAGRAAELAAGAQLVGAEIQALARAAEALRRDGRAADALARSARAVDLLDRQRFVEGSEEEVLFHHHLALRDTGSPDAPAVLSRARAELERKLLRLGRDDWKQSFLAVHAAIVAA